MAGMKTNNTTTLTREEIQKLPVVGMIRNNWRLRMVTLYESPSPYKVYMIGISFDLRLEVITEEDIGLNEKIAIDYWKHGRKIYTRD